MNNPQTMAALSNKTQNEDKQITTPHRS